jgi:uncharacterized membrane protein
MSDEKNSFLKKEWALLVILVIPFIIIAFYWDVLPDQIPLHWNFKGEANRWGPKSSIFEIPLVNIGISLLLIFLPKIDPRKSNYELFPRAYRMVRLVLAAFLFSIFLIGIAPTAGLTINATTFVFIALPLLFLVIGNFMRSFRQNFFAGIRTPWTLDNPIVWEKTHRLASWIWTGGSLLMLIAVLLLGSSTALPYLFVIYIVLLTLIPIVMSYIYYKRI